MLGATAVRASSSKHTAFVLLKKFPTQCAKPLDDFDSALSTKEVNESLPTLSFSSKTRSRAGYRAADEPVSALSPASTSKSVRSVDENAKRIKMLLGWSRGPSIRGNTSFCRHLRTDVGRRHEIETATSSADFAHQISEKRSAMSKLTREGHMAGYTPKRASCLASKIRLRSWPEGHSASKVDIPLSLQDRKRKVRNPEGDADERGRFLRPVRTAELRAKQLSPQSEEGDATEGQERKDGH